jgi:hypothetical protein
MDLLIEEKKVIKTYNIDTSNGNFALDVSDGETLSFESCRERFGSKFLESTTGFFMKHAAGKSENIAAFIRKTEQILKCTEFSKFQLTNHPTLIWIEPSLFWRKCYVRRSLFTILVRIGPRYDISANNFDSILFGEGYISTTKAATKRFLFGFTTYKGMPITIDRETMTMGWQRIFSSYENNHEALRGVLVKEGEAEYTPSFKFQNPLWL